MSPHCRFRLAQKKMRAIEGDPNAKNNVVLKIRRRKFGRSPVRAGEVTITRRLFRSGDSEYLLNGKICRLRDIQDIFMGTGLGGESYAIIGQERIGQLLSAKPHDRRAILEEAAGITRFKTKKRLAELRLEAAKLNLARVNDIFEEVTQADGHAEAAGGQGGALWALRDELRGRLRVVLASRMQQLDAEQAATTEKIAALTTQIDEQAETLEAMDAEHTAGVQSGYELDQQIREAGAQANQSAVELERITARMAANTDRVAELTQRLPRALTNWRRRGNNWLRWRASWSSSGLFWRMLRRRRPARARRRRRSSRGPGGSARGGVGGAAGRAEPPGCDAVDAACRADRNEQAQAEAALAGLEQESERLVSESDAARQELAALGVQRGQVELSVWR